MIGSYRMVRKTMQDKAAGRLIELTGEEWVPGGQDREMKVQSARRGEQSRNFHPCYTLYLACCIERPANHVRFT